MTQPAHGTTETHTRRPRKHHTRKRPHERTEENETYARQFPVHVGVDCGRTFHKLVARGPDGRRRAPITVPVGYAGFNAADRYLRETFPVFESCQILVAFEFAGHCGFTFAEFLRDCGYALVAVRSDVTKCLKEVEDNSPQKDDEKDAAQICKLISAGLFVACPKLSETVAEMRILATERVRITRDETRIVNRLHSALDLASPEFMVHFADITSPTAQAVLRRWPLPEDLLAAPVDDVLSLVCHVSKNHIKADRVLSLIAAAADTVAMRGAESARRSEILRLLDRYDLIQLQLADIDTRLEELVESHPGASALTSVPGIGVTCAATLVSELGRPEAYESPRQVLKLAGMNLARGTSGTSIRGRVKQTKRGRPLLRRQLFLLAGRMCQKKGLYREYYITLRKRNGEAKIAAMCAVARKLVPMLLELMQTGRKFDRELWLRNRHQQLAA